MSNNEFKIIDSEAEWKNIVSEIAPYSFMQSYGYSKFAEQLGYTTFLIAHYEGDICNSYALAYIVKAKRGTFLCISHGPIFRGNLFDQQEFSNWDPYLTHLAKQNNCSFIRVAPSWTDTTIPIGYHSSPIHLHAETTIVINLEQTKEELLGGMRKTMRQMIKKSLQLLEEKTMTYEWVDTVSDQMFEVYHQTTQRGHFTGFSKEYLQSEYDFFKRYEDAGMLVIKQGNTVLSWGLFIYTGNKAFYHHGANQISKEYPSAYLFYWLGIQRAKEMGCISYDLWGIAPKDNKKHPWSSISVFKSGFGGEYLQLAHAIDKPLSITYYLTWTLERIRAIKRGFGNYRS